MRDFTKLKVWEKAHGFTLDVYKITKSFPKEELYGVTSQMRRAAASIPMNLAEGSGREGVNDRARFFEIAFSSACEVEYQLILSRDLGYITIKTYTAIVEKVTEIKRMLASLIRTLKAEV